MQPRSQGPLLLVRAGKEAASNASDTYTNPRPGQFLMHAHGHTQAVSAITWDRAQFSFRFVITAVRENVWELLKLGRISGYISHGQLAVSPLLGFISMA